MAGADSTPRLAWSAIPSPIVLQGTSEVAYRNPLLHHHGGCFRLYYNVVLRMPGPRYRFHIEMIQSTDLVLWSEPRPITSQTDGSNFVSPGSIVRHAGHWVLCMSGYPDADTRQARCWKMESADLQTWGEPEVLRLGEARVIDPCIFPDRDEPGKWWCCFKQGGLEMRHVHHPGTGAPDVPPTSLLLDSMQLAFSHDLKQWTFFGTADAEENYCMLIQDGRYVLVYAPANGIGVKASTDLRHWYDVGLYTLGQRRWPWAQGRITAGHVLDMRHDPRVGRYLLVFHGATPRGRAQTGFHGEASIGLAWSQDMTRWYWPE